jgi:OOP family OmpA-OmpF porin
MQLNFLERDVMKKNFCLSLMFASAMIAGQASAATSVKGYMLDTAGNIVRNSYGECWHTGSWTPADAVPGCDGVEVKKPVVVAAPVAAPTPALYVAQPVYKNVVNEKMVSLDGANFATASSKLAKSANAKLDEVVNAAKQYPDAKFDVSGHTDNRGKKVVNQKLSEKRAASVKQYLVSHGVAADRISTAGYGDAQAVADNKTSAGRAANRRVDVRYGVKEVTKVRVPE